MQIKNKQSLQILLLIYVVISFIYICFTLWTNFRTYYIQKYFEQGRLATIEQLITQAEDEQCKAFSVYTEEKEIKLINTECLKETDK